MDRPVGLTVVEVFCVEDRRAQTFGSGDEGCVPVADLVAKRMQHARSDKRRIDRGDRKLIQEIEPTLDLFRRESDLRLLGDVDIEFRKNLAG